MAHSRKLKRVVFLPALKIGVVWKSHVLSEEVSRDLREEDVEFDLLSLVVFLLVVVLAVEVDHGDSEHEVELGVELVFGGRVHVELECDIVNADFNIHDDLLEQLLEEVHRPIFADLALELILLHIKFLQLV